MSIKLFFEAIIKFLLGVLVVGLLLFIPAASFSYLNAWLLMILLFVPIFITGIIMMKTSPDLLKKRLDVKEQKQVVKVSGLMFIIGFVVASLNYRYNWINTSNVVVIISSIIFIISYIIYAVVLYENEYLARTIKTYRNQKVIDNGLYSIVRHSMYLITIFLFLSMPLILGSYISFIIFLIYPFVIIKRIKNEEEVLEKELIAYKEYQDKVKWKLIPFIW